MRVLKKGLKIFKYIFLSCWGIIIVILLISFLKMLILGNQYMDIFGYSYFEIVSNSMSPSLKKNDVVLVKKKKNYRDKDIITYQLNDKLITHRIIAINNNKYLVKGDNSEALDGWINKNQIIGKVIKKHSNLGIIKKVILTPKILILIGITSLLFLFYLAF